MQVSPVVIGHVVRFVQSVGLSAAVAALALAGAMSRADEYLEFPDRDDVARLEAEFWQCERTAASIGMGFDEGLLCAELTERLKRERFNGSFDDMLLWWNAGKAASLGAPAGSSSGESDTSEMVP